MSEETPLLNLPLIQPSQAQKHVTHNEALRLLDIVVHLAVLDDDRTTPPALPAEGDRHIIPPAATGDWAGRGGQIAAFWGGAWAYVHPRNGWTARLLSQSITLVHSDGTWAASADYPETVPRLGIAATPDAVNRLSLAAPASLFSHDGAGHQIKVNKNAPADTASLLFQTAWSGRAELGLTGSDSFALRISADGTAFATALAADPASGLLSVPQGIAAPVTLCDPADPARSASLDLGALPAGTARSYTLPDISSEFAVLGGSQTFTGPKTFAAPLTATAPEASLGTSTGNATYGLGAGATSGGNSKTVNIATGGVAGSTTTLNLGPAQPGATGATLLHGTTVTLGPTVTDFDMGSASARAVAMGIGGATGDATNRLAVNTPAVLFNHAGAGIEAALNKSAAAESARIAFKTAHSTRAQLGLETGDTLALKLSPDGATFATALSVDPATARTTFAQPLVLQGQPADPDSPADGTVWYNGTTGQFSTRLGGQTVRLDGQASIAWIIPNPGEVFPTTCGAGGGPTGTLQGAAGRTDLYPFLARTDMVVDRISANCTAGVSLAVGRGLIYAADAMGRPATLIAESADLDLSIAGMKTAAIGAALRQGRIYWVGFRHSSSASISTWPTTATPDINGGFAPSITLRKVVRRTIPWTSAPPAIWNFAQAEVNAANAPALWLRMS